MSGYIYCLENESMPGLLKIGFTERTMEERLAEANSSGTFGPPSDYTVVFAKLVMNPRHKESNIHTLLKKHRINPKKEFFSASKEYVKLLFDLLDGDWYTTQLVVEDQDEIERANIKRLNEFLNHHIFPASPQSPPITTKLLLEAFSTWKSFNNYSFQIKNGVQLLQKLVRDTYGPPSSRGWTGIQIIAKDMS